MKTRRFFIAFLVFVGGCIHVAAQGISSDRTNRDGVRTIVTDERGFYDEESVGLTYVISPDGSDSLRILNFTIEDLGRMEKGRVLLIKLDNGHVIELHNDTDTYSHAVVRHPGGIFPLMCIRPQFVVTRQQLDMICSHRVVKLRFEQHDGNIDKIVRNNRFSEAVYKCRRAIGGKADVYKNF